MQRFPFIFYIQEKGKIKEREIWNKWSSNEKTIIPETLTIRSLFYYLSLVIHLGAYNKTEIKHSLELQITIKPLRLRSDPKSSKLLDYFLFVYQKEMEDGLEA